MNRRTTWIACTVTLVLVRMGIADDPDPSAGLDRLSAILGKSKDLRVSVKLETANDPNQSKEIKEAFSSIPKEKTGLPLSRLIEIATEMALAHRGVVLTVPVEQNPTLLELSESLGWPQFSQEDLPGARASPVLRDADFLNAQYVLKYDWLVLGVYRGRIVAVEFCCDQASSRIALPDASIGDFQEATRATRQSLQGSWKVASDMTAGKPTALAGDSIQRLAQIDFIEDSVVLKYKASKRIPDRTSLFQIDSTTSPPRIQLMWISGSIGERRIEWLDGVIGGDGENMRMCLNTVSRPEQDPPTSASFESVNEEGKRLLVLKRADAK